MTTPNSGTLAEDRRALLAQLLADEGLASDGIGAIPRRDDASRAPLSFAQEVLWLLERASSPSAAYNTPLARRIRGPLDIAALERALRTVVTQHESLRTVFPAVGDTAEQVVRPVPERVLRVECVSSLPADQREHAAASLLACLAAEPFDLSLEPAFRAVVVELAPDDHTLLLLTHHIISDAWSYSVLLDSLSAAYADAVRGDFPAPDSFALQFGDFAAWERSTFQGDVLEGRLGYWREQLAGQQVLDLPTDFAPTPTSSPDGACVRAVIACDAADQLRTLAAANGATLYMVLLAAFATVLQRYSGQDDITVGSAVAGRVQPETHEMVGYFSQALPLRTRLDGDPTFAQLIGRVSDTVLGAFEHQDVPVESLALDLRRGGSPPAPLFRVVLTMQDALTADFRAPGLDVSPVEVESGATKFDLTLLVSETNGAIELALWYRSALFEQATSRRVVEHLRIALDHVVEHPDAPLSSLDLLTSDDRAILEGRRVHAMPLGSAATMTDLIAASVAQAPDAIAVRSYAATLSAAELWRAAGTLASRILCAGGGECVILDLDRSVEAIVAMVAIWRAGAAYVPLSAEWPAARRADIARQSGARVAMTSTARLDSFAAAVTAIAVDSVAPLLAEPDAQLPACVATPDSLAYVLFTSGSTGTPKGVEVTHANAVHYTRAVSRVLADVPATQPGDGLAALRGRTFALASSLTADLGNTSVFAALASGATLDILAPAETTEPAAFAARVMARPVDVMKLTPSHIAALVADAAADDLRRVLPRQWLILGGEVLPTALARRVLDAGGCRLLNHYGPTETTIGACANEVTLADVERLESRGGTGVPVGRPFVNVGAYVTDVHGNEQPPGIPGELVLSGDGIARGYRGLAERTAERFVCDRVRGRATGRAYRTGDRVRWRAGEGIEFLGRQDDQVKIRGFRVELGEIEHVLTAHPLVERAVVASVDGGSGQPELGAWVVLARSAVTDTFENELGEWLTTRLPVYMIPSHVRCVDQFPLAPNGKIDRTALRRTIVADDTRADGRAPEGATETALAAIWAEVLRRDGIRATDNFLELGGQSLLAIRVLGKVSRTFGVRLSLRTLFESPTIEQLAAALETAMNGAARA